ncbi:MAG: hypothetical protein LIP01_16510 [Tannerellaceae bacterium]|nr:hypothetical protein [Tannerellaceae bacterium]
MAAVCLILTSCGSNPTTSPRVFNETLMKSFKTANDALEEFDSTITASVKADQLTNITSAADTALAKVDEQIDKVSNLNATDGEAYKKAVLTCFYTVKEIIEIGRKYATLEEGYSKSEFNALEKEYNAKRKQLSGELQEAATAASNYSKAVSGK